MLVSQWLSDEKPSSSRPRRDCLDFCIWIGFWEFETVGTMAIWKYTTYNRLPALHQNASQNKRGPVFCVFSPLHRRRDHTEHLGGLLSVS